MRLILAISITVIATSCWNIDKKEKTIINKHILSECNTAIQNAIVVDNVSAPAGGRRYYYACVAAYEALVPFYPAYKSLAGQLKQLDSCPTADTSESFCLDLVALAAHTYVSQRLVYKEDSISFFRERKLKFYKSKITEKQFKNSIAYGDSVGKHIVSWAKKDTFEQIRGRDFYTPSEIDGRWQPTSPDFAKAVEPNWRRIRPAVIPAANHFKIPDPEPFSRDKKSRFYKITKEVYDAVKNIDSQKLIAAKYWDDNPNTAIHLGHVTINVLKISPAGHWLSIFSNISRQRNANLMECAEGFARFSAVIHDAFIACWDAKYRTDYIRPETAIRMLIDSSWVSAIQTPAFPEYPSGHSVVSTAVGAFAEAYFGTNTDEKVAGNLSGYAPFIDSSELEFGLGTRKFESVMKASDEACMSRLWGGIHFIDAIQNGRDMGRAIAQYHIKHLKTKNL